MLEEIHNVDKIKEKYPNAKVTNNGQEVTGPVGTGNIINIDGKEYKIVKMGDIDGNGCIDAIDLLKIRRYLLGKDNIVDCYLNAMDVYNDGTIDAIDLLKIRKVLTNKEKIQVN